MAWLKKHDVLTRVISVLLAVALWVYITNSYDIEKNYWVTDIEPDFVGLEEITTSKNLILVGDYSVDVEVSGKRGDIMALNKAGMHIEVDVSMITSAGTYNLPYTVTLPSSEYTLKQKKPEKLTVKFEQENIKTIPVKVISDGVEASGYLVDKKNITMIPKELKLTGLREDVEKIAYAEVNTLLKDMKGTFSGKYAYKLYDADGNQIKTTSAIADYDEVYVNIPILKVKEVDLSLDIQGDENVIKYVNYSLNPKKVKVCGDETIIDQLTDISVGVVKVADIRPGEKQEFTAVMPDGVSSLEGDVTTSATISFVGGLSKKKVNTSLIKVINAEGITRENTLDIITKKLSVEVLGSEETLELVNEKNVRIVADLQSVVLSKGEHQVSAKVYVDGVKEVIVPNASNYEIFVEVK